VVSLRKQNEVYGIFLSVLKLLNAMIEQEMQKQQEE
jgi:hypothetical protein